MSLVVHLPLNGTTKQIGLSSSTFVGSPSAWNNGKIGKCAYWNGSINNVIYNNTTELNYTENFSVALWINPVRTGTNTQYAFTVGRVDMGGYGYGLQVDSATQITFRFGNKSIAMNVNSNEWSHVAMVVGASDIKVYKNGTLYTTTAIATKPTYSDGNGIGLGCFHYSSNIYPYYGSMNDFRIYDHRLSPMEVKRLSQGLVLHYPLNRNGWGQENLAKSTHGVIVDYLNSTAGSKKEYYPFNCGTALNVSNGDTVTISFDLYETVNTSGSGVLQVYNTNNKGPHQIALVNALSGRTIKAGDIIDERISVTTTISNRSDSNTPNDFIEFYTNYGTSNWFKISNLKIEKGSIATPWCPNTADALATTLGMNNNVEYDCSGYCNNGEKINALTYTSDTPKYNVSTHIGATNQRIHISNFPTSGFGNSYSIAWWGKRASNTPMFWGFSNGVRLNGMYTGVLWNTGDGSNNPIYKPGTTTTITAPSVNVWHHYVMTGDGTTGKLYLDGELYGQAKTYKGISGDSIYINGWDSSTSYCSDNTDISDFRIYATALSADDVKALYNNAAYIDNGGNIYGAVYEEA